MTPNLSIPDPDFRLHPYESPALRAVTGPTLRPGGLDLTRRAVSFCRPPAGARILDVGCGLAATVAWLHEQGWTGAVGLDRSSPLLAGRDPLHPGPPLVQADAVRLPFANRCFDLVLAECVLSLIAEPVWMLAECRRVMAAGASLVVTDLYLREDRVFSPKGPRPSCGCPSGARTKTQMMQLASRLGFETAIWEDHSDRLKRLAADLAWSCGSLAPLRPEGAGGRLGFCLTVCRPKDLDDG